TTCCPCTTLCRSRVMPLRRPVPGPPGRLIRLWRFSMQAASLLPAVAIAPHRHDVGGAGGLVLDFHPQAADIDVHNLHIPEVILTPDPLEDLFPAEGGAGERSSRG